MPTFLSPHPAAFWQLRGQPYSTGLQIVLSLRDAGRPFKGCSCRPKALGSASCHHCCFSYILGFHIRFPLTKGFQRQTNYWMWLGILQASFLCGISNVLLLTGYHLKGFGVKSKKYQYAHKHKSLPPESTSA